VEVPASEVESRLRLLVEKFGISEADAISKVVEYFLEEDGILTATDEDDLASLSLENANSLGVAMVFTPADELAIGANRLCDISIAERPTFGSLFDQIDELSMRACEAGLEPIRGLMDQLGAIEEGLSRITCEAGLEPIRGLTDQLGAIEEGLSRISCEAGIELAQGLMDTPIMIEKGLTVPSDLWNPDLDIIMPQLTPPIEFYPQIDIELPLESIRDGIRKVVRETVREVVREELKRMRTSDESDL